MNKLNFQQFNISMLKENKLRSIYGGVAYTCPQGYSYDWVTDKGCTRYIDNDNKFDHEVCDTNKCEQ